MRVNREDNIEAAKELRKLRQRAKRQIENQNKEMAHVRANHRENLKKSQLAHHVNVRKQRDRNAKEEVEAILRHQAKLDTIKKNFEETINRLEAEKEQLKTHHLHTMETNRSNLDNIARQKQAETKEFLANLEDKTNWKIRKAVNDANIRTTENRAEVYRKANREIIKNKNENTKKEIGLRRQMQKDRTRFINALANERIEQRNRISKMKLSHQRLAKEQKQIHDRETKLRQNLYKRTILNIESQFKQKTAAMQEAHKKAVATLKGMFRKHIQDIRSDYSLKKTSIHSKAQDKFYRIESLEPRIRDLGKEYLVSIEVPAHEQVNVHLTAHKRQLKLMAARRFEDRVPGPDGTVNHTRRSEVFSKDLNIPEIIDPRTVVRKYEDGILHFRLKKM